MDFYKHIRLFGLHLYISPCRMKRRGSRGGLCGKGRDGLLRHRHVLKLFGLHLYISPCLMKRRGSRDILCRNNRKRLLRRRHVLYKRQAGCCFGCGRFFSEPELELHHVIGVSKRPDLVATLSNLRLLCHDCHLHLHQNDIISRDKKPVT